MISDLYQHKGNEYKVLQPPSISKAPDERLISTSLGKDFIEIHDSTVMYGSPELADHLSGFIYMSVSMYEDKCSQGNDKSVLILEEIAI